MSQRLVEPYWKRFGIALCAAAGLVSACSLSMQLHVFEDPKWLFAVAVGTLATAIPGSALSALMFRNNQLALILGAQLLTVATLATWFGLRA